MAKLYGHWITVNYRETYGMFAFPESSSITNRPAADVNSSRENHSRDGGAHQAGLQKDLKLGNLDAKRDWGYTGDYVKAMHMMLRRKSRTTS